ncbi:hypothetical protein BGX34_007868 [Mortierella sp. NVP85]|nr:hypothetical protein BGX34_007868 [Mortierella sp. NVP85]
MADRRKRIVEEEDDDYGSASGSRSKSSSQRPVSKRPAPSGSSGPKRVIRDEDSDQDAEYTSSSTRRAGGSGSRAVDIPPEDFERLVKDVVRLAIFTAHSDHALRRDDIREVLNDHSRQFDNVFEKAQERLRDVFGMELVELTTKGRTGQGAEKGAKSYMLRNILPMELIASGAADVEAELEDMGLLMVVLSLIMVRQGAIYESALMSQLRRLSLLEDNSPFGDIQKKMEAFIKKRYLEKFKLDHMDDSGEKVEMEYRWGPRARIEFPEMNVLQFIEEVFGNDAPPSLRTSVLKAAGINEKEPAQQQQQQQ